MGRTLLSQQIVEQCFQNANLTVLEQYRGVFVSIKTQCCGRKIPTHKQLYKVIQELLLGSHRRTITMRGWKDREKANN